MSLLHQLSPIIVPPRTRFVPHSQHSHSHGHHHGPSYSPMSSTSSIVSCTSLSPISALPSPALHATHDVFSVLSPLAHPSPSSQSPSLSYAFPVSARKRVREERDPSIFQCHSLPPSRCASPGMYEIAHGHIEKRIRRPSSTSPAPSFIVSHHHHHHYQQQLQQPRCLPPLPVSPAVSPSVSPMPIMAASSPRSLWASPSLSAQSHPQSHSLTHSPSSRRRHLSLTPIAIPSPPLSPAFSLPSSSLSSSPLTVSLMPSPAFPALHPRYRVLQTLQQSLFGSVKLAEDRASQQRAVIKITRKTGAPYEAAKREADILRFMQSQSAESSNVVSLLDECCDDDETVGPRYHYLVTEHCAQGDLIALTNTSSDERPVTETYAKKIFSDVINGMSFIHSHGVAHLDLSLENVVIDKHGTAKIIDFGQAAVHPTSIRRHSLSKTLNHSHAVIADSDSDSDDQSLVTFPCSPYSVTEAVPMKLSFMSPEILSNAMFDAFSADVFALGVLLYTLVTGHPPFSRAHESDVWFTAISSGAWLNEHTREQPSAAIYTHLSDELLALIDACIKPEAARAKLSDIASHPWLRQ